MGNTNVLGLNMHSSGFIQNTTLNANGSRSSNCDHNRFAEQGNTHITGGDNRTQGNFQASTNHFNQECHNQATNYLGSSGVQTAKAPVVTGEIPVDLLIELTELSNRRT